VAEDVHVYDRVACGGLGGVGHLARRAVIVVAQFLEMRANFVRHLEGVQRRVGGEEAAIVGRDVQAGIAFIVNCSLSFWNRPSTASADSPSTSTCFCWERV
jgi:hypothetical protein